MNVIHNLVDIKGFPEYDHLMHVKCRVNFSKFSLMFLDVLGPNRKYFSEGAKSFFLIFFFPVENFHFGRPKTNFSRFEK